MLKRRVFLFAALILFCSNSIAGAVFLRDDADTLSENRTSVLVDEAAGFQEESELATAENSTAPCTIFYCLNTSGGKSWVRKDQNGVIGITYFQRYGGDQYEGTLLYKRIFSDGQQHSEAVTTGSRLEKSVLLYDSESSPHIFVARSTISDQVIDHYYKDESGQWTSDTIIHFYSEGGRFIYELSADTGPDGSFHLLILKSRSDVDSDDYWDAWINSNLYHLTNTTGTWVKSLIHNYNTAYTYDHYIKSSGRQDIKIDRDGFVHVVFSEQILATDDPSRLRYTTNRTGFWVVETALNYDHGIRDDAGWYPSLCLDNNDTPYISCVYINRVYTYSARYCKLYYLKRLGFNNWQQEIIADLDDGYYGNDGHDYTGGLSHLVFDAYNTPHIIFSDIASSHWGYQRLCVGNIRYGVVEDGAWHFTTIYRQPSPTAFYSAIEMYGMCLVLPDETDTIRVIGQELVTTSETDYTCQLKQFAFTAGPTAVEGDSRSWEPRQEEYWTQNHPNPFNLGTAITYNLPRQSQVKLSIYNLLGQQVDVLIDGDQPEGNHSVNWNGTDYRGRTLSTGIYFYRFEADDVVQTKKMLLLK